MAEGHCYQARNAKEHRDYAEILCVISALMCSQECRFRLMKLADSYRKMAEQVEEYERNKDISLYTHHVEA